MKQHIRWRRLMSLRILASADSSRLATPGFTIVELLVVIIVIAILAAITIVAYSGVTQSAAAASLQADLSNASTALKSFQIEKANFPTTISTDCSASPDTSTNKCLKISPGNNYVGYSANNSANPKSFLLIASNKATTGSGAIAYKVTDSTAPAQLANTSQPGTTPGAVLELHAAKANGGTGPGINSPLTTTWTDTSGNGNNGTLTNFGTQTPWGGSGTAGDPYRLTTDGTNDYVAVSSSAAFATATWTTEMWVTVASGAGNQALLLWERNDGLFAGVWPYVQSDRVLSPATGNGSSWNYGSIANFPLSRTHLLFTYDGTTLKVYQNAGSPWQSARTVTLSPTRTSGNAVGSLKPSFPLAGDLSVLRWYPFALTAAQVATNYAAGPTW